MKKIKCKKCRINLSYPESIEMELCFECMIPKFIHKSQWSRYRESYYKKLGIPYVSRKDIERQDIHFPEK